MFILVGFGSTNGGLLKKAASISIKVSSSILTLGTLGNFCFTFLLAVFFLVTFSFLMSSTFGDTSFLRKVFLTEVFLVAGLLIEFKDIIFFFLTIDSLLTIDFLLVAILR